MSVVNYLYLPLAAFALVLTGTRGATLASIPTAIFILWSLRHASAAKRVVALGAIAVGIVLIVKVAPPEMLNRISTAATLTDTFTKGDTNSGRADGWGADGGGALDDRWGLWTESLDAFRDRPIAGHGIDTVRSVIPTGKEAHNTYISVLVETGIIGFLLFGFVFFSVFMRIRHHSGWNVWYWFAQLSVLAIGAMSLSLEDNKSIWIFSSLAVASAAVTQVGPRSSDQRSKTLEPVS